jgi:hypothetical protein
LRAMMEGADMVPRVELWVAIGKTGRGAIGLSRQRALNRVAGATQVAVGKVSVWALCGAMLRYAALPISFSLEHRGRGVRVQEGDR